MLKNHDCFIIGTLLYIKNISYNSKFMTKHPSISGAYLGRFLVFRKPYILQVCSIGPTIRPPKITSMGFST